MFRIRRDEVLMVLALLVYYVYCGADSTVENQASFNIDSKEHPKYQPQSADNTPQETQGSVDPQPEGLVQIEVGGEKNLELSLEVAQSADSSSGEFDNNSDPAPSDRSEIEAQAGDDSDIINDVLEPTNDSDESSPQNIDQPADDLEIPSFKEFREKKTLADKLEQETRVVKKLKVSESSDHEVIPEKSKGKLIAKNYADNSCGAKILDSKKEFQNIGTVLNNNKDLYAMIPCEGSIWFVVELCDTIQINLVQLANYELFSSSVYEFKIYSSETYPTKEWKHLSTLATTSSRDLQKFEIASRDQYSKFVKFEKISHRGKEHFCVLSTLQVLGLSMVDEYEEQLLPHEEYDPEEYEDVIDATDNPLDSQGAPQDKSLIEGAKVAVKNIVDSALNVLGVSKTAGEGGNGTVTVGTSEDKKSAEEVKVETEPVIVKVDEKGKEIKEVIQDPRLKGEEQDNLMTATEESEKEVPAEPVKSAHPREVIIEAVDMNEESVGQEDAPIEHSAKDLQITTSVPDKVGVETDANYKLQEDNENIGESLDMIKVNMVEYDKENPEKQTETFEEKVEVEADKKLGDKKVEAVDPKSVVMTSSPKKNSIFVELDKKIKDLERGLSMSNDYLETLSSHYKKDKPPEKILSAVLEAVGRMDERLKNLEDKFVAVEEVLGHCYYGVEKMETKSSTLVTTTNLTLFLLMIMFYFVWRMSYKVNQLSLEKPPPNEAPKAETSELPRKRHKAKPNRDPTYQIKSRETSPHRLVSHKSETNLTRRNIRGTENARPNLEGVQMDLIYPQSKTPPLRRKSRNPR